MATEAAEHRRSVTITSLVTFAGVAAGVVSGKVASSASDVVGLGVLVASIVLSLGVLRLIGIDVGEFSKKDTAFVVFMALSLWFVTWTIMLTAGGA